MALSRTHLDNFREAYTISSKNEKLSNKDPVENNNKEKMLMWIPIISNIFAIVLFKIALREKKRPVSERIALASRAAIGFIAAPLLMPIDLIGTAIKCIIDARNKKLKGE